MWTKHQQKFKDQLNDQFTERFADPSTHCKPTSTDREQQTLKQMNSELNRRACTTDHRQLWRFEACHRNKIKRIYKNSKHFFRSRMRNRATLLHSLSYLIHLLSNCISSIFHFATTVINRSHSCLNHLFNICTIKLANLDSVLKLPMLHKCNVNCKLKARQLTNQLILILITFALLCNTDVCYANESCFGGIETFEKTAMIDFNTEIKPAGTLLQQVSGS